MQSEIQTEILVVTRRLFIPLSALFALALSIVTFFPLSPLVVPIVVMLCGSIGSFIGLQRRLKDLTISDLQLISNSWIYTLLSPLIGSILGIILYMIFLSGLITGPLFPQFIPDPDSESIARFSVIFDQHAVGYQDYAKLIFWCFLAGFSEKFVFDILSRFEGTAIKSLEDGRKSTM